MGDTKGRGGGAGQTPGGGVGVRPHLPLQLGALEGEQEAPHVVLPQLIDAARVDGAAQELIHLILGVERLLGTAAAQQWGQQPWGGVGGDGMGMGGGDGGMGMRWDGDEMGGWGGGVGIRMGWDGGEMGGRWGDGNGMGMGGWRGGDGWRRQV